MPTSVAHVTNHRTISRLRQFNEASVMRITFRNHKKPSHVIRRRMKKNEQYIYNKLFPPHHGRYTMYIDIFLIFRVLWH